jgi:hypothetical protein
MTTALYVSVTPPLRVWACERAGIAADEIAFNVEAFTAGCTDSAANSDAIRGHRPYHPSAEGPILLAGVPCRVLVMGTPKRESRWRTGPVASAQVASSRKTRLSVTSAQPYASTECSRVSQHPQPNGNYDAAWHFSKA